VGGRLTAGGGSLVLLAALLGCGATGAAPGAVGTIEDGFRIGVLLPDRRAERYEAHDRPAIARAIASLCPRCEVVYGNAGGDHAAQARQMAEMLAGGVRVFILGAVDPRAIAPTVAQAKLAGAKVVAYDRLANGPIDAYAAGDRVQAGRELGRALLEAIRAGGDPRRGEVVLVTGPADDPGAAEVSRGVHEVLDGRIAIGREIAVWNPDRVAELVRTAIAGVGAERVIGVCAGYGGAADAVAAAMRAAGVRPGTPFTAEGADPAAIRRILEGGQTAAVHRPIAAEAEHAARLAVALGTGRTAHGTAYVANGTTASIPAVLVRPVVVTRADLADPAAGDAPPAGEEPAVPPLRPRRPAEPRPARRPPSPRAGRAGRPVAPRVSPSTPRAAARRASPPEPARPGTRAPTGAG